MSIKIKESHKGKLHEDLGVEKGTKITSKELDAAETYASPAEEKRIVFARNAKKWKH